MNKLITVLALISAMLLTGCTGNLSGSTYSRSEARQVQQVQFGVVEAATPVVIEGRTDGIVGTGAGAVIGGIAASNIGGGRGQDIATVVGAIAGGVAGQKMEESMTRAQGQEVTVRLESGRIISVVQEVGNGPLFQAGDRVRVLTHGGTARVVY
jgi:outer membrane lipoprotein SlyB